LDRPRSEIVFASLAKTAAEDQLIASEEFAAGVAANYKAWSRVPMVAAPGTFQIVSLDRLRPDSVATPGTSTPRVVAPGTSQIVLLDRPLVSPRDIVATSGTSTPRVVAPGTSQIVSLGEPPSEIVAAPGTSQIVLERPCSPGNSPPGTVARQHLSGKSHARDSPQVSSGGKRSRLSTDRQPKDHLYRDALTRRQKFKLLKEKTEQQKENSLEEGKRDALLKQRERQRYYRFRDTRTHEEREEAMLRRREDHKRSNELRKRREEYEEYLECTFQPRIFTKSEERRKSAAERSSSCGAVIGQPSWQDSPRRESPRSQRTSRSGESPSATAALKKFLRQQQALVRKFAEIERETELAGSLHQEQRDVDVDLYRQNLEVVHALDRLDMQVLELPQAHLDIVTSMGYRLGLGEKGRRGVATPCEATHGWSSQGDSQRWVVESPRNNLREIIGDSEAVLTFRTQRHRGEVSVTL